MTPFKSALQVFAEKWLPCTNCELCFTRSKTVLLRGAVPAEVLFVGEAPGFSEDAIGQPFVGPAGHLLDRIVKRALAPEGVITRSVCFTNLVCCIPKSDESHKFEQPDHDHIVACQPRLGEFIELCKPKLIVRTGKLAQDYFDQRYRHALKVPAFVKFLDILHPAAILRANIANRELMTQKAIVQVSNAADDLDQIPAWGPDDHVQGAVPLIRRKKRPGEPPSSTPEDLPPYYGNTEDDIPF